MLLSLLADMTVVFCLCFVLQYFVSSLILQSSRLGRESWLLYFCCDLNVMSMLSFFGSSSRCLGLVCSMWLWNFLVILTYFFYVGSSITIPIFILAAKSMGVVADRFQNYSTKLLWYPILSLTMSRFCHNVCDVVMDVIRYYCKTTLKELLRLAEISSHRFWQILMSTKDEFN